VTQSPRPVDTPRQRRRWWRSPARLLALALSLAVLILGVRFGSRVASASDCYGYVSQADLWLSGRLTISQPWAARFSWPDVDGAFAPLGYRPGTRLHTIVPTYPPGLPLLMAAFSLVGGYGARFLVVPFMAAAGIWLTWRLGRLALGEVGGLLAALLLASSPPFLFQLTLPMSDIPAMTLWLAATVLVLRAPSRPLLAGIAASAAILVRPNLTPLVLVLAFGVLFQTSSREDQRQPESTGETQGRVAPRSRFRPETEKRSLTRFVAGALPGIAGYFALNTVLYGGPLKSGYGSFGELFALQGAIGTLGHYLRLLIETQTPLVAFALVGAFVLRMDETAGREDDAGLARRTSRAMRATLAGTVLVVLGIYAFYIPFEEWWYLRFVLPAYPALLILTVGGLQGALRLAQRLLVVSPTIFTVGVGRSRLRLEPLVLATVCLLVAASDCRLALEREVFSAGRSEIRYEKAAIVVRRLTPPNAAIICMQHSGTLRYYASRLTVRYDALAPDALDAAVRDLQAAGYRPFIVLEDWELASFRERFAGRSRLAPLDWSPIVRLWPSPAVFLYDAVDPGPAPSLAVSR
jgi:hypothetical protein